MDYDRLTAILDTEGACDAASRRAVYGRLRAEVAQSAPALSKDRRMSLERAIGKVEEAALAAIRRRATRPALVVEDFTPQGKDKIAA